MKKTKILIPLMSIASLSAAITPILTLTSCGQKPDESIKKIEATSNYTDTFVGATITKDDIQVMVYKVNGVIEQTTEWTCDELPEIGYKFEKVESKVFTIKYAGHSTTIKFNATQPGKLFIDVENMQLDYTPNFSTSKTFGIFAYVQEEYIQEIPHDYFTIESNNANVVYNKETKAIEAKGITNGTAIVTVKLNALPEVQQTFKVNVVNKNNQIIEVLENGQGVTATLGKANEDKTIAIPDYAKIGTKILPVTDFKTVNNADLQTINTIVIPSTVTKIEPNIFNNDNGRLQTIIYSGRKAEWNKVYQGQNWQGKFVMGTYCISGDDIEYDNFLNCLDTEFVKADKSPFNKDGLVITKPVGGIASESYTVQFNYSLIPDKADDYSQLKFWNSDSPSLFGSGFSIDAVYNNFTEIKYTTEVTEPEINTYCTKNWSKTGGTIVFNELTEPLSPNSIITIKFSTPIFCADAVYVGATKQENN